MNVTFRPIVLWPGQLTRDSQRRSTPFSARIDETWRLLEKEVEQVGGAELVVQLALDEGQIRLDGKPRAGAWPTHPGVIVSFESRYGPLQYATDVFTHWHANLRAIALGLEALRRVDRYGISKRGEQYTGWKALPGAGTNGSLTLEQAARFVAVNADGASGRTEAEIADAARYVLTDPNLRGVAYRQAAKRLHPDTGGDATEFARLQDAKRLLEEARQ